MPPIDVFRGFDGDGGLAAWGRLHAWEIQCFVKQKILASEMCRRREGRVSRGSIVKRGGGGGLGLRRLNSLWRFVLTMNAIGRWILISFCGLKVRERRIGIIEDSLGWRV